MTWWIVYDYGWYCEPYNSYATEQEAKDNLLKARAARPNAKLKVIFT